MINILRCLENTKFSKYNRAIHFGIRKRDPISHRQNVVGWLNMAGIKILDVFNLYVCIRKVCKNTKFSKYNHAIHIGIRKRHPISHKRNVVG